MGDRPRHRLFGAAGLAGSVAPGRAEDAGTQGDDRRLPRRHAAGAVRDSAGREKAGNDGQAARSLHQESVSQGREEAEHGADLCRQSGSAGYAVGLLFRDRVASADPAHHADAALVEEPGQPAAIKAPLTEVIEAADTVQLAAVRKDALAAVDELKTKGSDSRRNLDFWGQVGVGAVALGCVSAAALGQVAVGIPCVIGGSASQGLLSFWEKQQ